MRILLVTHYYRPEVGAPQRRLNGLVRYWLENGCEVHVVTALPHYPGGSLYDGFSWRDAFRSREERLGETVTRVPFFPTSKGGLHKLIDQSLVALFSCLFTPLKKADVVLTTLLPVTSVVPAWLSTLRNRAPLVIEMRDAWPDLIEESGFGSGVSARMLNGFIERAQARADALVTVSRSFGSILDSRGISKSPVTHISNGIDPSEVPILPPTVLDDRLRVLYLGTHGVSQALDKAIEAIAELGHGKIVARFIGGGTEKPKLEQLARELKAPITFENREYLSCAASAMGEFRAHCSFEDLRDPGL
jgi:glycosyltransferase involved in cell wall biosynthesis